MGAKVSNCGHDENNKYSGGKAGDQTGSEYAVKDWYLYSGGWTVTFRWKNDAYAADFAKVAKAAANNDSVGYDQSYEKDSGANVGGRLSYYEALKAVGWKPSKITTKCETDCSSSTCTNLIAVGHRLGISALKKLSPSLTTSSLRSALNSTGLFDEVAVKSGSEAKVGDINLKEGHHVNITVTSGSNSAPTVPTLASCNPNLKKGSTGTQVEYLQQDLNYVMKSGLSIDGVFGTKTQTALKAFQKKYSLEVDGIYGTKTRAKMKTLLR